MTTQPSFVATSRYDSISSILVRYLLPVTDTKRIGYTFAASKPSGTAIASLRSPGYGYPTPDTIRRSAFSSSPDKTTSSPLLKKGPASTVARIHKKVTRQKKAHLTEFLSIAPKPFSEPEWALGSIGQNQTRIPLAGQTSKDHGCAALASQPNDAENAESRIPCTQGPFLHSPINPETCATDRRGFLEQMPHPYARIGIPFAILLDLPRLHPTENADPTTDPRLARPSLRPLKKRDSLFAKTLLYAKTAAANRRKRLALRSIRRFIFAFPRTIAVNATLPPPVLDS